MNPRIKKKKKIPKKKKTKKKKTQKKKILKKKNHKQTNKPRKSMHDVSELRRLAGLAVINCQLPFPQAGTQKGRSSKR